MKLFRVAALAVMIAGIALAQSAPLSLPVCVGLGCIAPPPPPSPPPLPPLPIPFDPPPPPTPHPAAAPEIDPGSAGTALALLSGVVLILRSRGKK